MWRILSILLPSGKKIGQPQRCFKKLFRLKKVLIKVFGSASLITENKTDTSSFVRKHLLGTKIIGNNIKGDFGMKN